MARICLISNNNGWGLTKDVHLLSEIISSMGIKVDYKQWNDGRSVQPTKHDINFHLELVGGRHFKSAHKNILIPNPEWFIPVWANSKGRFNKTLVKTQHAVHIFQHIGFGNVGFMGFTTKDIYQDLPRKPEFLHMAGNSAFKGTINILKLWNKHPEWPRLHVFNTFRDLSNLVESKNIEYHFGRVNDLTRLQNECLYHIQPSESEGFGHILWESLATASITITTDAPPMSEIQSVIKVPTKRDRAYNYAWLYTYTVDDLEQVVKQVLDMASDDIKELSNNARQEYLTNDHNFRNKFKDIIKNEIGR